MMESRVCYIFNKNFSTTFFFSLSLPPIQNHHDLASQFVTCPFNARHMVPRGELSYHISRCDDQSCIEQDIGMRAYLIQFLKFGVLNKNVIKT